MVLSLSTQNFVHKFLTLAHREPVVTPCVWWTRSNDATLDACSPNHCPAAHHTAPRPAPQLSWVLSSCCLFYFPYLLLTQLHAPLNTYNSIFVWITILPKFLYCFITITTLSPSLPPPLLLHHHHLLHVHHLHRHYHHHHRNRSLLHSLTSQPQSCIRL